jgi:hypothetical protein
MIGNIEVMIDPIQLKILSRFVVQINQFKQILKIIMEDLNLKNTNYNV